MKTEESIKEDSKSVRLNAFLKCGISIGSKLCTNPQKKNKLVTNIKGNSHFLFSLEPKSFSTSI
ncbi:hypothetical protein D3C84_1311450 [compost metagenome]